VRVACCTAILIVLFAPLVRAEATSPDQPVAALVQSLSDPDPAVRSQAEQALVKLGDQARGELLRASHSDDPELAGRASQILTQLSWSKPTDPLPVRRMLDGYGRLPPGAKVELLAQLRTQGHMDVVLRVLHSEPNDAVRWGAVEKLSDEKDPELIAQLRKHDPAGANSAVLVLLGNVWWDADRPKALGMYRQAMALEASAPTFDDTSQVISVLDRLITDAMRRRRPEDAAQLLRQWIARGSSTSEQSGLLGRLSVLHAAYGPLDGFAADIETYGPTFGRPVAMDRLAASLVRLGLRARTFALAGHLAGDMDVYDRMGAAEMMLQFGRPRLAEMDYRIVMAMEPADEFAERFHLWAAHRLAYIAGTSDRDAEAAGWLEHVLALQAGGRGRMAFREQTIEAEMHWRRLRAARQKGDEKAAQAELEVLLTPQMRQVAHADIALDLVPLLREQGRKEQAQSVFDTTAERLRLEVQASPDDPEPMNNLAWLLARSDVNLDEALKLATRAIELDPENAAFLDTAAEANFRAGNAPEAMRLEQLALEQNPDDGFMTRQLERFRSATTQPATGQ
jgi:tetratricopeptide (TPR) repeat protein